MKRRIISLLWVREPLLGCWARPAPYQQVEGLRARRHPPQKQLVPKVTRWRSPPTSRQAMIPAAPVGDEPKKDGANPEPVRPV